MMSGEKKAKAIEPSHDVASPVSATAATGGLITGLLAFFAASCCALPLIFVILGMGGAWLSVFDVFLGYREETVALAAAAVAAGWGVYGWRRIRARRRPGPRVASGRPARLGRTGILLISATGLVIGAWLINLYQGDITRSLFELRSWLNA